MTLRNQIVSYFASKGISSNKTRIFKAPVSMNSKTALELLKDKFKDFDSKYLLHICYDVDSKRIYVINKEFFTDETYSFLLGKVKEKIESSYGECSSQPEIYGSPFSSLRVRDLDGFKYIKDIVKTDLSGGSVAKIPIIEVNLNRMPSVNKALPPRLKMYTKDKPEGVFLGGYISPSEMKGIHFYEEINIDGVKLQKPKKLLSQSAPFILINIGSDPQPSAPEKEWHILNGYREYFRDVAVFGEDIQTENSDAFLFAIKRFLKLGWTFEEVCDIFLKNVSDFFELISSTNELMRICYSFQEDGYENQSETPYYVSFKIDEKFPIDINSMISEENLDCKKQIPWFKIIDYNTKTNFIIIETPVYVREENWRKIFKTATIPFITRYNKVTNTIDVKSDDHSYINFVKGDLDRKKQLAKIRYFNESEAQKSGSLYFSDILFRSDENSRSIRIGDGNSFHLRSIYSYYDACEQLERLASKRKVNFEDLNIVVGPIERLFGRGTKGGFMDSDCFKKSEIEMPYEIAKGIFVTPPLIAIDSVDMPSPAEQASTLVHEYAHNLYSITHPEHESEYNKDPKLKDTDSDKYWHLYLTDEDERQAHSEQVKFELKSGISVDEMIRNKVGGQVTKDTYNIALLFKDIIDDAITDMENENE
jgi:hypothetical protein